MKRILFLIVLLISVDLFSQDLLSSDYASNYSSWNNGDDFGTGFTAWDMWTINSGGRFLGNSSGQGFGDVNTSSKSFSLWANPSSGGNESHAARFFNETGSTLNGDGRGFLLPGQSFKMKVAIAYRNGNKGIDILDQNFTSLFNFNASNDKYTTSTNTDLGWSYSQTSIFEIIVHQISDNEYRVIINRGSDPYESPVRTGKVSGFKAYCINTANTGDLNNLHFNSLEIYRGDMTTTRNAGVWDNGEPNLNKKVVFDDDYTSSGNIDAYSSEVKTGRNVTISSGNTLKIENLLNVEGTGTITFENNASLLQTNNVANTGNITYTRNSTSMKQFDFTYWSSPVAGEFLDAITNTDKLYDFNTSTNNWNHLNINPATLASTLPMNVGKGYAVRNPNTGSITQVGTFTGVPNNGDINLTNISGASGNSVFLGNPYPSAIDLEVFHTGSNATNLGNTYYFWTHNSTYNGTTYSGSDYANYSTSLHAGLLDGTRYVAAGQGFFVDKANASTISVEFKNSHRVSGNNSGFFRMAQNQTNSSTATVASDKIWFNLINPSQNILKQTLLAYAETASNGYDYIDALTYDGQPALDFYTLIPSYKFVIQARAWEFVDTDVVNIGYRTANAGTFQLVIDHFDPVWNTRSIVLKDNLLNAYHNIKESAYTFTSEAGTFDSRFEIIYQTNALGTNDVSFDKAVIVFAKDKNIHINSALETIKEVVVYDLQGRIITTKTNINATQIVLENVKAQTQVLLVKVTSIEGKITTKKVIF